MAEVQVSHLTKSFDSAKALDDVSLNFPDGEFFGLLGPSGSGKTTLLRLIAGFAYADTGSVRIGEQNVEHIPVEKRDIGMVFQNYALFPNMSVADNVGFGLRVRKVGQADEKRKVAEALQLVQLDNLGQRRPHQLSGGQRQRVALARAIVTEPRVLLLDEPLSALDKALRVDMQIELKRIQREVGITTIFVTHDQEEALTLSDRIGILKEGRLVQSGTPRAVYDRPENVFAARFLGEANVFQRAAGDEGYRLADGAVIAPSSDDSLSSGIAVRPENMTLSPAPPGNSWSGNAIQATLRQRIFSGAMGTCLVDWQGQTLKVVGRDQDFEDLQEASPVWVCWAPDKSIVLD